MMTMFFSDAPAVDYDSARHADTARYGRYFHAMLDLGIYCAPSQFECAFISTAHSGADIDATIEAAERALMHLAM
jgi:glutamate-1-semialdehyde 2,1-aminomutase